MQHERSADGNGASIDRSATDHCLVNRFRDGEQAAATELYLRYARRLQALTVSKTPDVLATRFDPEDVVQSVFRTFFRRVNEGLYDVEPGKQLWQLLLVISLNKLRKMAKHHRAQKRDASRTQGSAALEEAEQFAAGGRAQQDEASLAILQMVIDELLADLTDSQRNIIRLRIEGHAAAEIAERTKRSKRTVERVISDFRRELSDQIHGDTPQSA